MRRAVRRNEQNVKRAIDAGAFGPRLVAMLRRAAVASAASLVRDGGAEGDWAGDVVEEGDVEGFFAVGARDVQTRPPGEDLRRAFDVLWAFIAGEAGVGGGDGPTMGGGGIGSRGSSSGDLASATGSRSAARGSRERLARHVVGAVMDASRLDITAEPAGERTEGASAVAPGPSPAPATPPKEPAESVESAESAEPRGFTAASGNPFGDDDDDGNAGDPFDGIGGSVSEVSVSSPAASSRARVTARQFLDPEDVAAKAGSLLRRHAAHFVHRLVASYPRVAIDVARGRGAWTQLLSHDCRSPGVRGSGLGFPVSPGGVAAWLAGAAAAGDGGGHVTVDAGTGGNEPEVTAMLDAIESRALQPAAVVVLAPALSRLLAASPRPTAVALLRADAASRLAGVAKVQADAWGVTSVTSAEGVKGVEGVNVEALATRGVLEVLSTVLERGGPAVGAAATASGTVVDLMFELAWTPGTQGLAVRCLTALVASGAGDPTGDPRGRGARSCVGTFRVCPAPGRRRRGPVATRRL